MATASRHGVGGVVLAALGAAHAALALPIELKDANGTRYSVNTEVEPLLAVSDASGALTNATYLLPVTVTSYFIGITPIFGFITTYTVQRQVNVPLTNAFAGFNGLLVTSIGGTPLPSPLVFNPGEPLAAQSCPQDGKNRQLEFPPQTFADVGLVLTRKVLVANNAPWVRWLNVVTNTGAAPVQVGITLRGLIGSEERTRVVASSTGDSSLGAGDLWFTTAESVPAGTRSDQPRIGFVVQGPGATTPAGSVGISSLGQAAFTYAPTVAPGRRVIVMTFVTVQGNGKQAKNTVENVVTLPSKTLQCLSQQELSEVVNFAPITPPVTKKATIELEFGRTGQDTVRWKGTVNVGAGIPLQGLPVSLDVGGVVQTFLLDRKGKANDGGGNKFSLDAKLKNGVTKAGNAKFSFHLKNDFQAALAPYGLIDASVQDVPVSVPITFTAASRQYATEQPFTYDAKAGKSGTARTS